VWYDFLRTIAKLLLPHHTVNALFSLRERVESLVLDFIAAKSFIYTKEIGDGSN
jgi:hypothetical protein